MLGYKQFTMKTKKENYLRFLKESGYLPHHRFDYIYRLSKRFPSWKVIGFEGISEDEYKFVLSNSRKLNERKTENENKDYYC